MSSKSKTKGNSGERELCKILSDALGGNFIRVPNSGAFTGASNNYRKNTLSQTQNRINRGDLIPPDHLLRMTCECKSYKDFAFHQLLTPGPCAQLDTWIKQTLDCIDSGDFWFVAFKITRRGFYIAISEDFCAQMTFGNTAYYTGVYGNFRVTELADFLQRNKDVVISLSA